MQGTGQGVLPKVGQPQQGGEGHPPHPAPEGALLGVEAVGPHPLVAHQVQGLVLVGVIGLLKNGDVVGPALVEIAVLVGVDGVDLQPHHAEVFSGQLAGLADIFHIALGAALSGEDQDLLHAAVRNDLHLVLDLRHVQLHPLDMVVAVEAAVDTVVFAVIGDVQGGEEIDGVAEVAAGLQPRPGGHLLQEGLSRGGEEGLKILHGAGLVVQGGPHILGGIAGGVIGLHLSDHLVPDVGVELFHAGQILHVALPGGGIGLQLVLSGQGLGREKFRVHQKTVFHAVPPP